MAKVKTQSDLPKYVSTIPMELRRDNIRAVEKLIDLGHPLWEPPRRNFRRSQSLLEVAVSSGFYSMVEMLLGKPGWILEDLGYSLIAAVGNRREDLVHLLLDHQAPPDYADMSDVIGMLDDSVLARFVSPAQLLSIWFPSLHGAL